MSNQINDTNTIWIRVVSPVHIGSGNEYYPYEYYPDVDNLKVFNLDLFIKQYPKEAEEIFAQMTKPLWLLMEKDKVYLGKNELIRNQNKIDKNIAESLKRWAKKENAATIWEFIKTNKSEPYIPGSSIKGAFRTAIAYAIMKKSPRVYQKIKTDAVKEVEDKKENRKKLVPNDEEVVENTIFRDKKDGKNDLMRLWSVSDSQALPKDNVLMVVQTQRLSKDRFLGFRNYYEVLSNKTPKIEVKISFAESLAQTDFLKQIEIGLFPQTLKDLFDCVNIFVDDIIDWELNYFRKHPISSQLSDIINFYESLKSMRNNGKILLPFGKGTGWIKKSVGLLFKRDQSPIFSDIFRAYKLGRKKQRPEIFPSSREIIVTGTNKMVFGWAEIVL
ncbi:MAG: type III-A CRISPR-associated RAMP protein Csm5 [candidate division WOR-3 bacterium]